MTAKLRQGLSPLQVGRDLSCVPSTVVKTARRFAESGEAGLIDQRARTMKKLMVQVVAFLRAYNQRKKLNPSLKARGR